MTQVVVLLEQDNQDALEWAAAEAAARSVELRVVYAFRRPYLLDVLGELTVEEHDLETAEVAVEDAIEHVRNLFPSLRISSTVFPGREVDALVSEAADGALVVISRGHRFERKLSRRLARRTKASLAVVGLALHRTPGPSSGRVVVAVDRLDRSEVLGFAFGAARRRGTGLTVLYPTAGTDCVSAWRTAYPEVEVRCGTADGPAAVLAESTAAALIVLTADHHWRRQTTTTDVARLSGGPVVLV